MDLRSHRRDYVATRLLEENCPASPFTLFGAWLNEALDRRLVDANAMALSTVGASGQPSCRVVLLKSWSEAGLTFFTRHSTRKGQEIARNPRVSLLLHWRELERQVSVLGTATRVSDTESAEYFASRPRGSQLSARAASGLQGPVSRQTLEARLAAETATWAASSTPPPMPDDWGGYLVRPTAWEFWQGQPNRFHDRLTYERVGETSDWRQERLAP